VQASAVPRVQDRLRIEGLLGSKVQVVSVTVDPRRDSAPVLAAYVRCGFPS
jgi:cytochrome oxidase Cu insertion factor (SCO1/SenC/PrrC family)